MKRWTYAKPDPSQNHLNTDAELREYYNTKTKLKVDGHEYTVYSYTIHLLTNDNDAIIDDAPGLHQLIEPIYYDTYWADNKKSSLFECLCDTAEDVAWLFKKLKSRTGSVFSNETYLYFKKYPDLLNKLPKEDISLLFIGMLQFTDTQIERLNSQVKKLTEAVNSLTLSKALKIEAGEKVLDHNNSNNDESNTTNPSFFK